MCSFKMVFYMILILFSLTQPSQPLVRHVSNNGINQNGCGTVLQPCKTIEFTYYKSFRNNDTILLHNDELNHIYNISYGLYLLMNKSTVTIKSMLNGKSQPIIRSANNTIYLFKNLQGKNVNLHIDNIRFENIGVLESKGWLLHTGSIELSNCFIGNASNGDIMMINILQFKGGTGNVTIEDTRNSSAFIIEIRNVTSYLGIRCQIERLFKLLIDETSFRFGSTVQVWNVNQQPRSLSQLNITNTKFEGKTNYYRIYSEGKSAVVLDRLVFRDGSAIKFEIASSVQIYRCQIFDTLRFNTIVVRGAKNVILEDIIFNEITVLGKEIRLIDIGLSNVQIKNTTFLGNTAMDNNIYYFGIYTILSNISIDGIRTMKNTNLKTMKIIECSGTVKNIQFSGNLNSVVASSYTSVNLSFFDIKIHRNNFNQIIGDTAFLAVYKSTVFFQRIFVLQTKNTLPHQTVVFIVLSETTATLRTIINSHNYGNLSAVGGLATAANIQHVIAVNNTMWHFITFASGPFQLKKSISVYDVQSINNKFSAFISASASKQVTLRNITATNDTFLSGILLAGLPLFGEITGYVSDITMINTTTNIAISCLNGKLTVNRLEIIAGNNKAGVTVSQCTTKVFHTTITNTSYELNAINALETSIEVAYANFINFKGVAFAVVNAQPVEHIVNVKDINVVVAENTKSLVNIVVLPLTYVNILRMNLTVLKTIPAIPVVGFNIHPYGTKLFTKYNPVNMQFSINCPLNSNPVEYNITDLYISKNYYCKLCDRGLYTVIRSSMKTDLVQDHSPLSINEKKTFKDCRPCPAGGICQENIKSNDNFWGYADRSGIVTFVPCPEGYCCTKTGKKCESYTTCNNHRHGKLCGKCDKDYIVDYFSSKCLPMSKCQNVANFWILFAVLAILYVIIVTFLDKLKTFFSNLKGVFVQLCSCFKKLPIMSKRNESQEMEMININTESVKNVANNDVENTEQPGNNVDCEAKTESTLLHETDMKNEKRLSNDEVEHSETDTGRKSGILNVLVAFYQLKSLVTVHLDSKYQSSVVDNILTDIFNVNMVKLPFTLCPISSMNNLSKLVISDFLFVLTMMLPVIVVALCLQLCRYLRKQKTKDETKISVENEIEHINETNDESSDLEQQQVSNIFEGINEFDGKESESIENFGAGDANHIISPFDRLWICLIRLILLKYKTLAKFAMILLNCRYINNESVLYIYAEVKCWNSWQYATWVFFIGWVIPFPFALYLSLKMLKRNRIPVKTFLILMVAPIVTPIFYVFTDVSEGDSNNSKLKLEILQIFEEPFRLNSYEKEFIYWDSWRLIERLALSMFAVYFIDPLYRLSLVSPIMICLLIVHLMVLPYKDHVVNKMETASLACLNVLVTFNLFRAFLYVYSLENEDAIALILRIFGIVETILNPLVFIIIYGLYSFVKNRVTKNKKTEKLKKED